MIVENNVVLNLDSPFNTTATINALTTSSSSQNLPFLTTSNQSCSISTGYYYYPSWVFSYPTVINLPNSVQVKKAENGFVVEYNNKIYVARNENDVAKIIAKQFKEEK